MRAEAVKEWSSLSIKSRTEATRSVGRGRPWILVPPQGVGLVACEWALMYSPVHFISIFIGRHVFNYLSFFFFVCGPLFFLNGTDVDRHLKKVSLSLPLSAGFSVTQAGRSSSRDI